MDSMEQFVGTTQAGMGVEYDDDGRMLPYETDDDDGIRLGR